jgi:hypothetical protein
MANRSTSRGRLSGEPSTPALATTAALGVWSMAALMVI